MAGKGLGDFALVNLAETDLNGGVAIGFLVANLRHHVLVDLHDGDGNDFSVLIPNLRHA